MTLQELRDPPAPGKLVVIGPPHAGKSTLISRLCRRPINLEVDGRTVAMDHGMLQVAGRRLSVVGVPGQSRFASVQEALAERASAVVWVRRFPWLPDAATATLARQLPVPRIVFLNQTSQEARLPASLRADDPADAVVRGDLLSDRHSGLERLVARLADLLSRS